MQLLTKYPPQTSSRKVASFWWVDWLFSKKIGLINYRLCDIHNMVNKRLDKEEFDCSKLDKTYDCGCGDAPVGGRGVEEEQDGTVQQPGMIQGG